MKYLVILLLVSCTVKKSVQKEKVEEKFIANVSRTYSDTSAIDSTIGQEKQHDYKRRISVELDTVAELDLFLEEGRPVDFSKFKAPVRRVLIEEEGRYQEFDYTNYKKNTGSNSNEVATAAVSTTKETVHKNINRSSIAFGVLILFLAALVVFIVLRLRA